MSKEPALGLKNPAEQATQDPGEEFPQFWRCSPAGQGEHCAHSPPDSNKPAPHATHSPGELEPQPCLMDPAGQDAHVAHAELEADA